MTITIGSEHSASLGFGNLGLMELGLGGGTIGSGTIDPTLIPKNFTVRRGSEGPQAVIEWETPQDIQDSTYSTWTSYEVILERRTLDFSYRVGSATQVYKATLTGSAASGETFNTSDVTATTSSNKTYVSEISPDLISGKSFYYTLYVKMPTDSSYIGDDGGLYVTNSTLQRSVIILGTDYFYSKMFDLLPAVYKNADNFSSVADSEDPTKILTTATGTGTLTAERFNFLDSQTEKYGPLYRFFKILSTEFDLIKGLIDYVPSLYDVNECDHNFLRFLASNYALDLNTGLTVTRQRADLRNIVHFYKWKGTEEALETRGEAVTTARDVYVKEYNENIFLCNKTDRTTAVTDYGFGRRIQPHTEITFYHDPKILQSQHRSLLIAGSDGDSDTVANQYTVTGLGSQVNFPEVANYGDITGLDPYERLDSPGEQTVEGWIKVKKWPKPGAAGAVQNVPVLKRTVDEADSGLTLQSVHVSLNTVRLSTSNHILHRLAFYTGDDAGKVWIPLQFKEEDDDILLDTPVHFALTRSISGTTVTYELYKNGVSQGTDTSLTLTQVLGNAAIPIASKFSSGSGFTVGGTTASDLRDSVFMLDEVRVWDVARDAADILADYNKSINSHKTGLIFHSNFEYKNGESFFDTSVFGGTGTGTIETRGQFPDQANGITTDPWDTYDWAINKHQQYFLNDGNWYVHGDPVGINGVRFHAMVDHVKINYSEFTV